MPPQGRSGRQQSRSVNGDTLPRVGKVVQVMLLDVLQNGVGMEHRGECAAPVENEVQALALGVTEPEKAGIAGKADGGG